MNKLSGFEKQAQYYDLLYAWKNYQAEAELLKKLIQQHKKSTGNNLLEVACGTGAHIPYLKDDYAILATDINQHMLTIAKKKYPDVTFKLADMVTLDLKKQFDIILCLFSSIGYIKNYKNLDKTIANFAKHLNKGGVVIIEPWFTPEKYRVNKPAMHVSDGEKLKIARLCVAKKRGMLSILDMHHLVAEEGADVRHFVEHHELAMFDITKMLEIMKKYQLKAKFLKNGLMPDRGLLVGVL